MKVWRKAGQDTVIAEVKLRKLAGFHKAAVAQENLEAIVVLKNGLVEEISTAGSIRTLSTWEAFKRCLGLGPSIQIYYLDITPRTLEFWLEDPAVSREQSTGQAFGMPGLTSDGQLIPAQVNVTVSVNPERPDLLLRALHGRSVFTLDDLRVLMRDELLGKVIGPALAVRTAGELRGDSSLLDEFYEEACAQIGNTLEGYGLKFDVSQFYINWGLTYDESREIEKRRIDAEIAHIEHLKQLEQALNKEETPAEEEAPAEEENRSDSGVVIERDLKISINK